MVFKGKVLDSVSNMGIPYASVRLMTEQGTFANIGVSANGSGDFTISGENVGWPYYLEVTAAEYEPVDYEIYDEVATNAKIYLIRKVKELDPVIVTSGGKKDNYTWLLIAAGAAILLSEKKKKAAVGKIEFNTSTVITGAAILVALKGFNLLDQLLAAFGLGKDKDDRAFDDENADPESPLKPTIYTNAPTDKRTKAMAYVQPKATQWGNDLISSFGYFYDDEAQAIGVFKKFRSQIEASCFAYIWEDTWGYPDLLQWLKGESYPNDRLDTGEINEIIAYLHALPLY